MTADPHRAPPGCSPNCRSHQAANSQSAAELKGKDISTKPGKPARGGQGGDDKDYQRENELAFCHSLMMRKYNPLISEVLPWKPRITILKQQSTGLEMFKQQGSGNGLKTGAVRGRQL